MGDLSKIAKKIYTAVSEQPDFPKSARVVLTAWMQSSGMK
jgi:hypothetical protein